ncbi:MAG: methionine--tRNA ligase, partial [Deltaproteobacteria bacterium]|nr:methionine--tRNA ligase [Deltaproteobacteria bacterium]
MSRTYFVSTAIPYVNAEPHVGFAYELVLADILARHRRRRGDDVRFVSGTDDNSLKNVGAAAAEGVPTQVLVDRNAEVFRALGPALGVAPDDFVRTSRDPRHRAAVAWLWSACAARGDLYRRVWSGRYCLGCEAFVDDGVAVCAEHDAPPQVVHEENWFFRLSRWREPLREAIASGRLNVAPDWARAETLAFLDGEVRDLSVSRDAARAGEWGLRVPGDPGQVIYVWFDALANYLASLGLGGDDPALLDRYWHRGRRDHVIGKGITRFHAVYWPAFLLSAGLPLPDRILVHAYLTRDGRKIGKSSGGYPIGPLLDACGADGLRWYFARRCRTRGDADVDAAAACDAHDRDLVDKLGNLVQRCTALLGKLGGRVPARTGGGELA